MTTIDSITTAEQLLHTPGLGRCELVRGELLTMSPAGFDHGRIVVAVTAPLAEFVRRTRLGVLAGAETGFQIAENPDTVRAPDVAFVRAERVPSGPTKGFFRGAPDLAVEVLSPDDRASDVLAKVEEWLDAGCRAVWVVDPRTRTVTVHRSRNQIVVLKESDALAGDDVLPGFSVAVAEIFAG